MTDPRAPVFQTYLRVEGDVSPEGVCLVPAKQSPNRKDMLVVTNEVSGTTTTYEIVTTPRD